MRKILLFILAILFINSSWAQDAPPEMFKFQAYIYKPNGNPVEDKTVGVEISIYLTSLDGTLVYTEEFTTTTNKTGIISLEIGNGIPTFGNFSEIPWEDGEFFLELSADIDGGTNYTFMGASQLLSVPYALLAKNALSALDDFDTDPTNEIELPEEANENDVLTFVNGVWVAQSSTDSFKFYYADKDEDGFGDKWYVVYADIVPEGFVSNKDDCNNGDPAINPDAIEVCDGIDNNCDGNVDEGVLTTYYADADEDGFGDSQNTTEACTLPIGYVENNTDCDDTNPNVYPGAKEICPNGLDDNCDGQIDVNCYVPEIGDFYGGGVVYYILQPSDNGYDEGKTKGFICTLNNYAKPWSPSIQNIYTYLYLGYGSYNTNGIVYRHGNPHSAYAAGFSNDLNIDGFTAWFLPSYIELYQMYINRAAINSTSLANGGQNLYPTNYWSSSQYGGSAYYAYTLNMSTGHRYQYYKTNTNYFRPVRTFILDK